MKPIVTVMARTPCLLVRTKMKYRLLPHTLTQLHTPTRKLVTFTFYFLGEFSYYIFSTNDRKEEHTPQGVLISYTQPQVWWLIIVFGN